MGIAGWSCLRSPALIRLSPSLSLLSVVAIVSEDILFVEALFDFNYDYTLSYYENYLDATICSRLSDETLGEGLSVVIVFTFQPGTLTCADLLSRCLDRDVSPCEILLCTLAEYLILTYKPMWRPENGDTGPTTLSCRPHSGWYLMTAIHPARRYASNLRWSTTQSLNMDTAQSGPTLR